MSLLGERGKCNGFILLWSGEELLYALYCRGDKCAGGWVRMLRYGTGSRGVRIGKILLFPRLGRAGLRGNRCELQESSLLFGGRLLCKGWLNNMLFSIGRSRKNLPVNSSSI